MGKHVEMDVKEIDCGLDSCDSGQEPDLCEYE
jgi:hypothetical protein